MCLTDYGIERKRQLSNANFTHIDACTSWIGIKLGNEVTVSCVFLPSAQYSSTFPFSGFSTRYPPWDLCQKRSQQQNLPSK